jgi:hypothetical protein
MIIIVNGIISIRELIFWSYHRKRLLIVVFQGIATNQRTIIMAGKIKITDLSGEEAKELTKEELKKAKGGVCNKPIFSGVYGEMKCVRKCGASTAGAEANLASDPYS